MVDVKTLDDALEKIIKSGSRQLILAIWTDNVEDCKPIVRAICLHLPQMLSPSIIKDVFLGINSKLWILSIEDERGNTYNITTAQEFARKGCSA